MLHELRSDWITPAIKSFFNHRDPAGLRCIAVLAGIRPGTVFSDSHIDPNWVIVWESTFGAIYPGGDVPASIFHDLIYQLRREKMVYLGLWSGDQRWKLIQPKPDYESRVLDFYDRIQDDRLQKYIEDRPEWAEFHSIDRRLIERSTNRDLHLSGYTNLDEALKDLIGYFLMKGDEILCEALAGAEIMATREIGIDTLEPHRRRGYATITCAKLIQRCEQEGYHTYWNCNKENTASVALARKLGYQTEKEYKLLIWNKTS